MITDSRLPHIRPAIGAFLVLTAAPAIAVEPVRVASLLPYVQDALGRLDGRVRVVATVRRELWQAPPAPIVDLGNPHSPSFERLAEANPQLVVGERALHGPLRDRLARSGAEVMLVESSSIDSTFDGLMEIARRVGGEPTMARAVAEARAGLAAEALGEPVPTLLLFGAPGSFMVVTDRTWLGDLLKRLNLKNVAAAVQGKEAHPGFVQVSDEVLAGLRPELVLLVAHGDEATIRSAFRQRLAAGGPLATLGRASRGVHVLPPQLFGANPGLAVVEAGRHLTRPRAGGTGHVSRFVARIRLVGTRLGERPEVWAGVLALALVAAVLVAGSFGATHIPFAELPRAFLDAAHPAHGVLWQVRVPRVLSGVLVGASLGVSGALMQAAVRNPLADPGLMGVTAGAGVGGMIAIVAFPGRPMLAPVFAFAGGLAAVLAVVAASWTGRRRSGPLRLVLSGVAVQAIMFSVIALLNFTFADRAPAFVAFTIGSLNGLGWREAGLVLVPAVLGIGLAVLAARPLNLLLLDDDSAGGVGLAVRRARLGASCLAALLAAGAASVAGLVSFVGLVVPNWVRVLVGPDHRVLIPLCVLGGATLLVVADLAARMLAAPLELPVGALLALIGGPYFLVILWRRVA